jgi:hypothetical protein
LMSGMWKRSTAKLVRHRQPKGPVTDRPSLKPPRHISTLQSLSVDSGRLDRLRRWFLATGKEIDLDGAKLAVLTRSDQGRTAPDASRRPFRVGTPDIGAKRARRPRSPGTARTAVAGSRRTRPDGPGPLFFSCASRPSSLSRRVKIVQRARPSPSRPGPRSTTMTIPLFHPCIAQGVSPPFADRSLLFSRESVSPPLMAHTRHWALPTFCWLLRPYFSPWPVNSQ